MMDYGHTRHSIPRLCTIASLLLPTTQIIGQIGGSWATTKQRIKDWTLTEIKWPFSHKFVGQE